MAVEGVRTTHSNLATISSLQASQSAPESDAASSSTDDDNDDFLQRFWDLDTVGIRVDETPVSERFLDDIRYDAQKPEYEVRLPRKSNIQDLPSNYNNAAQRLYRELDKLKRDTDPDALRKYHEVITDQLNANKIEKCDAISTVGVHYLPHRGVKKETSETTKLRVVYDASSKSKGAPSLNDCLTFAYSSSLRRLAAVPFIPSCLCLRYSEGISTNTCSGTRSRLHPVLMV